MGKYPRVWSWLGLVQLVAAVYMVAIVTAAPVSAQTPTPAPVVVSTPAPGIIAQPVVVVGYGEGARGVDYAILAAVIGLGGACLFLLLFMFLGGRS